MSAILSGLTKYVDEQRLPLISKLGLEAKSAKEFELMTGVKGDTALNLLDVDGYFQDGKACGWNDSGSAAFTQRVMHPAVIKIQTSICQNAMYDYWMNFECQVGAGRKNLPFEQEIMDKFVTNINEKVEKLIWQGDTAGTGDLAFADGLVKILNQTTGATGGAVAVTASTAATVYEKVLAVYNAIPSNALPKAAIYVSLADFRALVLELAAKNLYHWKSEIDDKMEIIFPATSTRIVGVAGLDGANAIVALVPSHTFYGCDLAGDKDDLRVHYSEDNDEYRFRASFVSGVEIAYPSECAILSE